MIISTRPLKLLPLVLVLGLDPSVWEFFLKPGSGDDPALGQLQLALLALGLGAAVWYWRSMEPAMGRFMLLTVAYLLGLMLDSYATHGTWIIYMHVFSKVLVLFMLYGTYGYYHRRGLPPLRPLVGLLLLLLVVNLATQHPEALSLKGFLDNERGFSADSALLLLLPTLLCLNWFLQRSSPWALLGFFIGLVLIIFLQHRSVWIATLVALPINLVLGLRRVPGLRISTQRLVLLVALPLALGSVAGLATLLQNPTAVKKKFADNYEDLTKADKQGTGSWRVKQMQSYTPLVAERPLLGWRLEGFEVPMQFYDPSSDQPMWRDGTGHHFHSFYLDRMFYFGWLGVLLVVTPLCMQVIRRLANPAPLTAETAALISLLGGCLVFGLSYDWPLTIYPVWGLLLASATPPAPVPAAPAPRPAYEPEPLLALSR
ncbi:O-antigen ligase family protein [Hymenobacter sp. H14-R3]|uniref:O-antigen ligase family protein n=1 Tax=Hymenobacter sp. H14-R3 TaxID=3046308 RepID=UPI0024B8D445|nr:O-antigen ligase family protein [Hymenobacter sp. H14-R3]MDJ0367189.1 O-antigen ligase family protein [Hymenobacter sp. H14-R3]